MTKKYTGILAFIILLQCMSDVYAGSFFSSFKMPENYQKYLGYLAAAGLGAYSLQKLYAYSMKKLDLRAPYSLIKDNKNIRFDRAVHKWLGSASLLYVGNDTYQLMDDYGKWEDKSKELMEKYLPAHDLPLEERDKLEGSQRRFDTFPIAFGTKEIVSKDDKTKISVEEETSNTQSSYVSSGFIQDQVFVHDDSHLYAFAQWKRAQFKSGPKTAILYIDERITRQEDITFIIKGVEKTISEDIAYFLRTTTDAFSEFFKKGISPSERKTYPLISWEIYKYGKATPEYETSFIDLPTLFKNPKGYEEPFYFIEGTVGDNSKWKEIEKTIKKILVLPDDQKLDEETYSNYYISSQIFYSIITTSQRYDEAKNEPVNLYFNKFTDFKYFYNDSNAIKDPFQSPKESEQTKAYAAYFLYNKHNNEWILISPRIRVQRSSCDKPFPSNYIKTFSHTIPVDYFVLWKFLTRDYELFRTTKTPAAILDIVNSNIKKKQYLALDKEDTHLTTIRKIILQNYALKQKESQKLDR